MRAHKQHPGDHQGDTDQAKGQGCRLGQVLNVFAEIYVTGSGGRAGNLPFLVYQYGLIANDVGGASAGGIVAVVLANIVAFFLMRMIGKNLEK